MVDASDGGLWTEGVVIEAVRLGDLEPLRSHFEAPLLGGVLT